MTTTTTTALDLDAIKADPGARDVPALIAEVERLRAKLDQPCGSCHPCTNYRDETWRAADRKPPHVHEWDELRNKVRKVEMVKVWTNEDGKRFVFADDLAAILLPATVTT